MAGLSPAQRMLRALLISGRNLAYFLAVVTLFREATAVLPAPVVIVALLSAAVAVYLQVRSRDHRGQEVSPALLLGLFLLLFAVMASARSMADQTGFAVRYGYVIDLDAMLFAGTVPTVWLQEKLHSVDGVNVLDAVASLIYFSYFVVPVILGTVLWHVSPNVFRLYLATTMLMIAIGSVSFTVLPTAPPWLAGIEGHLPPVARIAPEVAELVRPGFYEKGYQAVGVNDVAAFPSFHTAQTMAVTLAAWRFGRGPGFLGAAYVAAMGFSLVYLGEHYVSDVLAGLALASGAWLVALKVTPRHAPRAISAGLPASSEGLAEAA